MSKITIFYVDIRIGCCAVRDHRADVPGEYELTSDTPGVAKWWSFGKTSNKCPTCGHVKSGRWLDGKKEKEEARAEAARLNAKLSD